TSSELHASALDDGSMPRGSDRARPIYRNDSLLLCFSRRAADHHLSSFSNAATCADTGSFDRLQGIHGLHYRGARESTFVFAACRVLCRVLPLFRHWRAQGSALCTTHRVGSAAFRHTAGSCTPCRPIDFLGVHHILPPGGSTENTGGHRNRIATGDCMVRVFFYLLRVFGPKYGIC